MLEIECSCCSRTQYEFNFSYCEKWGESVCDECIGTGRSCSQDCECHDDEKVHTGTNCSDHRFISTGIYRDAMRADKLPPAYFRYVCVACGERKKVLIHGSNRDRFEGRHAIYLGEA